MLREYERAMGHAQKYEAHAQRLQEKTDRLKSEWSKLRAEEADGRDARVAAVFRQIANDDDPSNYADVKCHSGCDPDLAIDASGERLVLKTPLYECRFGWCKTKWCFRCATAWEDSKEDDIYMQLYDKCGQGYNGNPVGFLCPCPGGCSASAPIAIKYEDAGTRAWERGAPNVLSTTLLPRGAAGLKRQSSDSLDEASRFLTGMMNSKRCKLDAATAGSAATNPLVIE